MADDWTKDDEWLASVLSQRRKEWAEREERQRRNLIQLTLTFLLFSTLSLAQYVLGDVSGSSALKADAVAGGCLALLILAGIASELSSRMVQFGVALLCYVMLLASAIIYMIEGLRKIRPRDDDTEEDVNVSVVLIFSILGIVVDILSVGATLYCDEKKNTDVSAQQSFLHEIGQQDEDGGFSLRDELKDDSSCGVKIAAGGDDEKTESSWQNVVRRFARPCEAKNENPVMLSTFLGVIGDSVRSLMTLTEAIVIIALSDNGSARFSMFIDGVCTVMISCLVFIIAVGGLKKWLSRLRQGRESIFKDPQCTLDDSDEIALTEATVSMMIVNTSLADIDRTTHS